jgi:hypothetical protein
MKTCSSFVSATVKRVKGLRSTETEHTAQQQQQRTHTTTLPAPETWLTHEDSTIMSSYRKASERFPQLVNCNSPQPRMARTMDTSGKKRLLFWITSTPGLIRKKPTKNSRLQVLSLEPSILGLYESSTLLCTIKLLLAVPMVVTLSSRSSKGSAGIGKSSFLLYALTRLRLTGKCVLLALSPVP